MTSQPASEPSDPQGADPEGAEEAVTIPLKPVGLNLASETGAPPECDPEVVAVLGDYSTSVKRTLGVIEAMETTLQDKRAQIEEIQARQRALAQEYKELGRTLETASRDLAQKFSVIITDLETDRASGEPLADKASGSGGISALDLDLADLPPVPEFLGGRQDILDKKKEGVAPVKSGPRAWWKNSKKSKA